MSVTIQDAALQKQKDDNRLHVNPGCTFQCLKAESDTIYTPPTLQQDDGVPSGWKPLSLSAPILSAVAILSLLIAAAVEVLAQKSAQDGGLALSATQDDIPRYAMIFYLYGPNVVAVLYSLIWSWIDLDTKRMQPWFELSKPNGATAANSLFLDYPYDFVAFVPWKAARRKHWPVMLSGLTMVLVFWVVTPLQSAVLGLGTVSVTQNVNITTRGRLVDVDKQQELLDPRVLSTGYAIGWLGQPYPSFMTGDYALLPFYVDEKDKGVQHKLTATTTKMWTDLECWPAKVSPNGPPAKAQFDFLNGQGCNTTINLNLYSNYTMLYVGYYSSAYSDFALGSPSCPETEQSKHQFLAIWAETQGANTKTTTVTFNITAMYCQPSYLKQDVTVTVSGQTRTPVSGSFSDMSSSTTLKDTEFNSTAFEYLLANGIGDDPIQHDFPFNSVIEQHPRLADKNLTRPVSNMVGFALAGQNLPVSAYSNTKILQHSFENAHRSLFSIAVSYMSTNQSESNNHTATTTTTKSGVMVSRTIAASLESVLGLVGVFAFALLWLCRTAPSNLHANPSSIARISEIFRSSADVLGLLSSRGTTNESTLHDICRGYRFKLRYTFKDSCPRPYVALSQAAPYRAAVNNSSVRRNEQVNPAPLTKISGGVLIASLVSLIAALVALQWQVIKQNGFTRPTDNFELLQLLENYIPTIIATFLEPFWVLLNRLLCVLHPFRVLAHGHASQLRSVEATYTAIPPQLSIWRAFKNSHYLLVSLCSIALLANVLSVGLGALFNEAPALVASPTDFHSTISDRFNGTAVKGFSLYLSQRLKSTAVYPDHMYIEMANITLGTSLPPWTTSEYFFQPISITDESSGTGAPNYLVTTHGFGMSMKCNAFKEQDVQPDIPEPPNRFDNLSSCPDYVAVAKARMRHSTLTRSSGLSAIEYSSTLSGDLIPCDSVLTYGWGRTIKGQDAKASMVASFAVCKPVLQTGLFEVRVDRDGFVQSYEKRSDMQLHQDVLSNDMVMHANHLVNDQNIQWHNDTLSRSWMSYLVATKTKSRSFLDPTTTVPDPDTLIPILESLHQSLFAILLSQNQHLFLPADSATSLGQTLTQETRIFMDRPALIVSLVVLCLNAIVAVVFYARVQPLSLPHMPSTIGSVVGYIAASRGIKIFGESKMGLELKTVGFGRYVGRDGKFHVGIELDPYIVSMDSGLLGTFGKE